MDPIHPILPVPRNIPPVTEAPRVGKVTRDERRDPRRDSQRDEEREPDGAERRPAPRAEDGAPGEEPRPHIDLTA